MIKSKISDLDKMKIEEQKRAVRSGYDMDVLPSDPVSYTHLSKEPPKKQPIKEALQDKADEKNAQRTVPAQAKHKQQDMEL